MTERTEGLEFSDVVGIRYKCASCHAVGFYTRDQILKFLKNPNLIDSLRCPDCSFLPAEGNLARSGWVSDASVLLDAIHRLAATQSSEPKPSIKLSFEVRSKDLKHHQA